MATGHGRPRRGPAGDRQQQLPGGAHRIAAVGRECEDLMIRLYGGASDPALFDTQEQEDLAKLAGALASWNDHFAVPVVEDFVKARRAGRRVEASSVAGWLLLHPNDPDAVLDCLRVDLPNEIGIIRLLSRAGSQKLVFLATWKLTQRQVVLKRLLPPAEEAARIISRESQTHPLSLSHPNVIETFLLQNDAGEVFLVEEYLPVILSDEYRAQGIEEGSNLLFDIANAITYLHDTLGLVHGDIKPDNLGKRRDNYVLLDFGICRPRDQFHDVEPTGSLRTRAPELLLEESYIDPDAVDVWALCASIFNAFVGRFPLLDEGESPPRLSTPSERDSFIATLAQRARTEYDQRVNLSLLPDQLRPLLAGGLAAEPRERTNARDLRDSTERSLAAYLRASPSSLGATFSPREEVQQYRSEFGRDIELLKHMPWPTRQAFRARLTALADFPYLEKRDTDFVQRLLSVLS